MPNRKTKAVFLFGAGVGFLFGAVATLGFLFLRPHPTDKSAFFSVCTNWQTLLDKSVPGNEVVLKNRQPNGGSESVLPGRSYRRQGVSCDVSADKRGMDRFMRALQSEMYKLARQTGARIDDADGFAVSEGRAGGKSMTTYFEFQYTTNSAHGKVTAHADTNGVQAGKPGSDDYRLRVQIEEWVH
jgi:hypothetical protein